MSMSPVIQVLKAKKRFLISTHVNPDPDALCSELALAEYLRSAGKSVTIVNDAEVPRRFRSLPGGRRIRSYGKARMLDYDVAVIVDCGDLNRIGRVQGILQQDRILINIDHHISNDRFGDYNLVCPKVSSTAEVLYELLKKAKCRFTKSMARHLYIGIMTDTGCFRYENTSAQTHAITAELMKWNLAPQKIYQSFYEVISFKDLKEFFDVMGRFSMHFNGKVATVELTRKVLGKFSGDFDLRDSIFKFLRAIKGVEVVVILTEVKPDKTQVNLRSTETYDVAKLAGYFKGGGHRRASGGMIEKNIAQARKDVLNRIRKEI